MSNKKWGLKTIVLYGINCVIGSGIFLLPGSAYKLMGPGSLLAYIFVLLLVMSIALCFAECASMFEESGGPYLYSKKAFGEFFGYEVGVMKWVVSIIAWATMAVAFTTAISVIFPVFSETLPSKLLACGIIAGLSICGLFGLNIMAYLNNICTIGKLVPMAIFVIGGLFFIKVDHFVPLIPTGTAAASVSAAIIMVFYAFTGFENVGVAAGDMENPAKNVPKALIISMSLVSLVYILVQFNCIGILGGDLTETKTPVADAMGRFLGSKGALLVTLGTLVSIGGLNVTCAFNTPRCAQALADGKLLPDILGKKNRFNVPYIAVIITAVFAMLLTLTGTFSELAAISVVSRFSQYIPTCLAVLVLRKKHPEMEAKYRAPLGIFFPVIAIVASAWLLYNTDNYKLIAGLGAMIIVAPLYLLMKKKHS